jgi:hypothetical protein
MKARVPLTLNAARGEPVNLKRGLLRVWVVASLILARRMAVLRVGDVQTRSDEQPTLLLHQRL